MKILIIGGTGLIGGAVAKELKKDTQLLLASFGNSQADYQVDISSADSIEKLFKQTGKLDGIVCAAAQGLVLKPLVEMVEADYVASMQQKLLGQINIVLKGIPILNDHGSITLTTGIMNRDIVKNSTAVAMANSALEGFAYAAAFDAPRGIRINVVSPGLVKETAEKYAAVCPGFEPVESEKVARAFRRSIYGIETGMVYCVR